MGITQTRGHTPPRSPTMDVVIETPDGKSHTMEIWFFSTVLNIKNDIQKHLNIPVQDQTLTYYDEILEDDHITEHYDIHHNSTIKVSIGKINPNPKDRSDINGNRISRSTGEFGDDDVIPKTSGGPVTAMRTRKMEVKVQPIGGNKEKLVVVVNECDGVSELRKELLKLGGQGKVMLPEEGFFFIHGQTVMNDEGKSFRWYGVKPGDTIDMFLGWITR